MIRKRKISRGRFAAVDISPTASKTIAGAASKNAENPQNFMLPDDLPRALKNCSNIHRELPYGE